MTRKTKIKLAVPRVPADGLARTPTASLHERARSWHFMKQSNLALLIAFGLVNALFSMQAFGGDVVLFTAGEVVGNRMQTREWFIPRQRLLKLPIWKAGEEELPLSATQAIAVAKPIVQLRLPTKKLEVEYVRLERVEARQPNDDIPKGIWCYIIRFREITAAPNARAVSSGIGSLQVLLLDGTTPEYR